MTRQPLTKQNVLIVVPALNEAASIGEVLSSLKEHGHPTVVVSDGSVDATADIARASGVAVLELAINLGVGGALRAGFQYACRHGYEAIIQVDAVFDYDGEWHSSGDDASLGVVCFTRNSLNYHRFDIRLSINTAAIAWTILSIVCIQLSRRYIRSAYRSRSCRICGSRDISPNPRTFNR